VLAGFVTLFEKKGSFPKGVNSIQNLRHFEKKISISYGFSKFNAI
jgi:hypothetical protein